LGGYCLGARIAFEMAQQLTSEGQKIALLANFNGVSSVFSASSGASLTEFNDTSETTADASSQYSATGKKVNFKKTSKNIIKSAKGKALYNARKTYQIFKKLPFWLMYRVNEIIFGVYFYNKMKAPAIVAKLKVIKSLNRLQSKYEPKAYQGSMIIFRSPAIFSDPYLGWNNFVKGKIETFEIPGEHKTRRDIMNEPHVQYLAEKLSSLLNQE